MFTIKVTCGGEESKTTDAYIKESSTYVKYFMPALCVLLYCVAVCNIGIVFPKIASLFKFYSNGSFFIGYCSIFLWDISVEQKVTVYLNI